MAKSARKKLVDKLDQTVSKICRERQPMCEKCGGTATQVHHFFGRRKHSVRWDFDNLISLCWPCHKNWAHQFSEECRDYLIGRIGQRRFNRLKVKANNPANFTISDLKELLEELKRQP